MTGKFTQNVHSLGYTAGQTIHSLYLFLTSTSNNDDAPSSLLNFSNNLQLKSYNLTTLKSMITNISTATSLNYTNISPTSLLQTLLSIPNRYKKWWLNLLHSDPLHVLVETLLLFVVITLVVIQRRADWNFTQERKKSAPTANEEEELINEWKHTKRKLLGGKEGKKREGRAIGVQPRLMGEVGISGSGYGGIGIGLVIDKIVNGKLYLSNDSKLSETTQTALPESVLNFATLDYLSSSSSSKLRQVASASLAHYGKLHVRYAALTSPSSSHLL